ncbi:MAG: hypothetical protein JRJ86_18460 [Deltaproteobacteria bacterium]|nr:hypothetical protein [Deltaproteobacteria bacterium]MBW2116432.1 hypothetical protein [Deltaproteobacteria bacterium]MBW2344568.1 hypothetical protein [Deltaproteobacteria bacterium]
MNIKKGVDRLSIVLAVLVMVILTAMIIVIGWNEGFASFGKMVIVIIGAAIVSILGTLFGIRGIAYILLWVIDGFKEEKKVKE